jgi:hypothetical protein
MAETKGTAEPTPPATREGKPPAKMTSDELDELVKRAKKGDRKCLPQLREALKSGDYPNWSRWFRDQYGNPAEWLKDSLARMAGGEDNLAVWEASEATMDQLRKDLEGPNPTAVERLLAERAASCWFLVNFYETLYTQSTELTIRQAEFQLRRIESAQKRFLSALKTLAMVRKLALPAIQLNLAERQVNVAGPG